MPLTKRTAKELAMMQRAYSTFEIKSINEELREIEGIASTPATDRMDDIVEPMGAEYALPLPFLWQHDSRDAAIGEVFQAKPTKDGIPVKIRIARCDEPGDMKDRLDYCWQAIKLKLVRGLSIGFNPIEYVEIANTWGYRFTKWAWLELSAVTIPANQEATITAIKSADRALLAASGVRQKSVVRLDDPPGASGSSTPVQKGPEMKTIAEQIAAFEAKRAATVARRDDIQSKAIAEGRSKDKAEKEEFDTLSAEIESIDSELKDLRLMAAQAVNATSTTVVTAQRGNDPAAAAAARAGDNAAAGAAVAAGGGVELGSGVMRVGTRLEPGQKMARYAMALIRAKGNLSDALAIFQSNKNWMDTSREVELVLRTAVAAGDTTTSGWASELVYNQNLAAEFIEYLRPMTILGKLTNLRKVPFNVRMGSQTAASSANWVGQGLPIPMSKMTTSSASLGITKAAGLVAIDEELARSASPSAELLVRDDMAKVISTFLDVQFVDPSIAAVANVNPASVTNGLTPVTATGATAAALRTDLATMLKTWAQGDIDMSKGVFIMTPNQALNISLMLNSLGIPLFPEMGVNGGKLIGLPVITSNSANIAGSPDSGNMIIAVNEPEIFLADDGQIALDVSREASIQMLDNPTNASAGGTVATTMVSMFQTASIALRAIRFINWAKRRTTAVVYIKEAAYVA